MSLHTRLPLLIEAGVAPFFKEGNAPLQLRNRGLIDSPTGSLDQLRIELPMIHSALSRHGSDQQAMSVPQAVLLVV